MTTHQIIITVSGAEVTSSALESLAAAVSSLEELGGDVKYIVVPHATPRDMCTKCQGRGVAWRTDDGPKRYETCPECHGEGVMS